MKQRWVPVGLLALAIFVVNAAARFVSWKAHIETESAQLSIGYVGVALIAALLVAATAWWTVRYPFPRVFGEVLIGLLVGALLSVVLGPYFGGSKPFVEGLAFFVGQVLLFLAVGLIGAFLGFAGVVAFGKDWKSRGLRRYEETYGRKPRKTVRG